MTDDAHRPDAGTSGGERPDRETGAGSIPPESAGQEHEVRDLSLKGLVVALLALTLLVAFAMGVSSLVLGALEGREAARRPEPRPLAGPEGPPQPRLETIPGELRRQHEAAQQQILQSYAWLDRERGTVRIPIERAMDVLAERGLPAREREPADGPRSSGSGGDPGGARQPGGLGDEPGRAGGPDTQGGPDGGDGR